MKKLSKSQLVTVNKYAVAYCWIGIVMFSYLILDDQNFYYNLGTLAKYVLFLTYLKNKHSLEILVGILLAFTFLSSIVSMFAGSIYNVMDLVGIMLIALSMNQKK